jgi:hypothetical protein
MDAGDVFRTLEEDHRNSAMHLGATERALIEAACRYLAGVDYEGTLVRHVVYFLAHSGARLSQEAIALVTGRTDRTVREIAHMDAERFRRTVTFSPKESAGRPPKIAPRLVPLVTEYLLRNRVTSKGEVLRFLREEHGLTVCRDTLNDLLKKYDLDRLIAQRAGPAHVGTPRPEAPASPLFSAGAASPARG